MALKNKMQVLTGDAACQGSQGHANAQCYVVSRKARTVTAGLVRGLACALSVWKERI